MLALRVLSVSRASACDSWLSNHCFYMSGNACYSMPAFNKKISCHLNTESQVWFQSRKCSMQFGVCTRLHTVASMSHESAPDCEQNCLQETFCLSCCPPQPSFPIPVFLLSSVPFFVPLLPFLFCLLCSAILSFLFFTLYIFLGNSWFSTMMQFNSQTICVVFWVWFYIFVCFLSPH